jgi:hypothetical protein
MGRPLKPHDWIPDSRNCKHSLIFVRIDLIILLTVVLRNHKSMSNAMCKQITSSTSKTLQTGALFETYTPILLPPHFQGSAIMLA